MFCGGDDIGAIVADVGSHNSRIGFAGEDIPRSFRPSLVGCADGATYHDLKFRENMSLEEPVKEGIVSDWDLMEKLWENVMTNELRINSRECPVLLAEKPYNPSINREKACEMLFEKFQSPALFMSKDAVLNCYSCGRTSGLVVDVGASGTVITPVVDGWVETKGLNKTFIGSRTMDALAYDFLRRKTSSQQLLPQFRLMKSVNADSVLTVQRVALNNVHPTYESFMQLDIARQLKESVCKMSESRVSDNETKFANMPSVPFELPDGTIVEVGLERFTIPEILCSPPSEQQLSECQAPFVNTEYPQLPPQAVPRMITDSIIRCDSDVQSSLLSSIVITGGGSSFDGLTERLRAEVEMIVAASAPMLRVKSVSCNVPERVVCAWLGGSILASLGSFHEMWFSRQEYSEFGANLIHRKCP